jgi:hypothetical protein
MSTYGTLDGVQAYIRHMTFDAANNPTSDQIEVFLESCSAVLTGCLASGGYQVPVTQTEAKAVLDNYANLGAAGYAELTQRTAGFNANDENKRENKFLDEFRKACKFIESGALAGMGVPQLRTPGPLFGLSVGGKTASGQALTPIFGRGMFGNLPAEEYQEEP